MSTFEELAIVVEAERLAGDARAFIEEAGWTVEPARWRAKRGDVVLYEASLPMLAGVIEARHSSPEGSRRPAARGGVDSPE